MLLCRAAPCVVCTRRIGQDPVQGMSAITITSAIIRKRLEAAALTRDRFT
jgi:hypothetical protein